MNLSDLKNKITDLSDKITLNRIFLIFSGLPGSGKTSLCDKLEERGFYIINLEKLKLRND